MNNPAISPRPLALVTGASSGIGAAMARELAARGHDLILVARREAELQALARELEATHGVLAAAIAQDLAQPGSAAQLWEQCEAQGREIDVLINNAGFSTTGEFATIDAAATRAMLQLNILTLTELARLALPGMLARRRGHILNVASLAGFQPGGPRMAAYYASKSYVLSFTRGLAAELAGSGVSATALCPGPVRTGFEATAGAQGIALFRWVRQADAETVARAGVEAMLAGRAVVVPGLVTKMMALGARLSPGISLAINRALLAPGA